jgi:hypothetical protein
MVPDKFTTCVLTTTLVSPVPGLGNLFCMSQAAWRLAKAVVAAALSLETGNTIAGVLTPLGPASLIPAQPSIGDGAHDHQMAGYGSSGWLGITAIIPSVRKMIAVPLVRGNVSMNGYSD